MYDDTFYSDLDGQIPKPILHGKLVRSDFREKRVVRISLKEPNDRITLLPFADIFPDFNGTVDFIGEPIALALSSDESALEDIGSLVQIDAEDAPAQKKADIVRERTNIAPGSESALDEAFGASELVVEETWASTVNRLSCRETEGALATFDGGALTVFSPLSETEGAAHKISAATHIPKEKISFMKTISHGKNTNALFYCELCAVLAAFAAARLNSPVKISLSRGEQEEFVENHIRVTTKIASAVDKAGTFVATKIETTAHFGYASPFAEQMVSEFLEKSFGLYESDMLKITARAVFDGTKPAAIDFSTIDSLIFFGIENQIQKIAGITGISPKMLRMKNLAPEESFARMGQSISRARLVEAMKKVCGILDESVRVSIDDAHGTDENKRRAEPSRDAEFSPSVFERKWASYRLSNKKKSILSKMSNLRGTALSLCYKETKAETLSGTSFAVCTVEVEVNPLTYKEHIKEVKIFVNGGKLVNQEAAVSSVKTAVQEAMHLLLENNEAECDVVTVRFLKSDSEPTKVGDLIYSVLPAAFTAALSQALDKTVATFPLKGDAIFTILEEER